MTTSFYQKEKHVVPTPLSVGKGRKKISYEAADVTGKLIGPLAVCLRCECS
jgi:hypothetical protein